jgi:uncharacterized protein (DUF1697 family)
MQKVTIQKKHEKMTRYIAFLRGINVGGKNIIAMKDLQKMFLSAGYKNVETYIQSGNVIFESEKSNVDVQMIEKHLSDRMGYPVQVILRTFKAVVNLLSLNPFGDYLNQKTIKCYISFLSEKPRYMPPLPIIFEKEGLELFRVTDNHAFVLSREVKGRFGFPNNLIESKSGIPATTRNWTTISKMIQRFNS